MIEQMTYTHCSTEMSTSGEAGYQVKDISSGLSIKLASEVGSYIKDGLTYEGPKSLCTEVDAHRKKQEDPPDSLLSRFPASYAYFQATEDLWVFSRTVYRPRASRPDNRWHVFFSHAYLFTLDELAPLDYNPVNLKNLDIFMDIDLGPTRTLPSLERFSDYDSVGDRWPAVAANPLFAPELAKICGASVAAAGPGGASAPVVVTTSDPEQTALLIDSVLMMMPKKMRSKVPFVSYATDPGLVWSKRIGPNGLAGAPSMALIGTPSKEEGRFVHTPEGSKKFTIFDFNQDMHAQEVETGKFILQAARMVASDFERLSDEHDFLDSIGAGIHPEKWDAALEAKCLRSAKTAFQRPDTALQGLHLMKSVAATPDEISYGSETALRIFQASSVTELMLVGPSMNTALTMSRRLPDGSDVRRETEKGLIDRLSASINDGEFAVTAAALEGVAELSSELLGKALDRLVSGGWTSSGGGNRFPRLKDDLNRGACGSVLARCLATGLSGELPDEAARPQIVLAVAQAAVACGVAAPCWEQMAPDAMVSFLSKMEPDQAETLADRLIDAFAPNHCASATVTLGTWRATRLDGTEGRDVLEARFVTVARAAMPSALAALSGFFTQLVAEPIGGGQIGAETVTNRVSALLSCALSTGCIKQVYEQIGEQALISAVDALGGDASAASMEWQDIMTRGDCADGAIALGMWRLKRIFDSSDLDSMADEIGKLVSASADRIVSLCGRIFTDTIAPTLENDSAKGAGKASIVAMFSNVPDERLTQVWTGISEARVVAALQALGEQGGSELANELLSVMPAAACPEANFALRLWLVSRPGHLTGIDQAIDEFVLLAKVGEDAKCISTAGSLFKGADLAILMAAIAEKMPDGTSARPYVAEYLKMSAQMPPEELDALRKQMSSRRLGRALTSDLWRSIETPQGTQGTQGTESVDQRFAAFVDAYFAEHASLLSYAAASTVGRLRRSQQNGQAPASLGPMVLHLAARLRDKGDAGSINKLIEAICVSVALTHDALDPYSEFLDSVSPDAWPNQLSAARLRAVRLFSAIAQRSAEPNWSPRKCAHEFPAWHKVVKELPAPDQASGVSWLISTFGSLESFAADEVESVIELMKELDPKAGSEHVTDFLSAAIKKRDMVAQVLHLKPMALRIALARTPAGGGDGMLVNITSGLISRLDSQTQKVFWDHMRSLDYLSDKWDEQLGVFRETIADSLRKRN